MTDSFLHSTRKLTKSNAAVCLQRYLTHRYVSHVQSDTAMLQSPYTDLSEATRMMKSNVAELIAAGHADVGGAVFDRHERLTVALMQPVGFAVTEYGRVMLPLLDDPEWMERCTEQVESCVRGTPSKRSDGTDIWGRQP